jgi:hypothetical protein
MCILTGIEVVVLLCSFVYTARYKQPCRERESVCCAVKPQSMSLVKQYSEIKRIVSHRVVGFKGVYYSVERISKLVKGTTRAGRESGRRMANLLGVDDRCSDSNSRRRKATNGPWAYWLACLGVSTLATLGPRKSRRGWVSSRNYRCPRSAGVLFCSLEWLVL